MRIFGAHLTGLAIPVSYLVTEGEKGDERRLALGHSQESRRQRPQLLGRSSSTGDGRRLPPRISDDAIPVGHPPPAEASFGDV